MGFIAGLSWFGWSCDKGIKGPTDPDPMKEVGKEGKGMEMGLDKGKW